DTLNPRSSSIHPFEGANGRSADGHSVRNPLVSHIGNDLVLVVIVEIGETGIPATLMVANPNLLVDTGFRLQVPVPEDITWPADARSVIQKGTSVSTGLIQVIGIRLIE